MCLTRQIAAVDDAGRHLGTTGTLATGPGFSGFLIGAGRGALDWRAAALVMGPPGQGGGLLATYDSDGNVRFREHTTRTTRSPTPSSPATGRTGPAPARTLGEDVVLLLEINPAPAGHVHPHLTARRFGDGDPAVPGHQGRRGRR